MTSVPRAIDRKPPRGLARIVELFVVVAAVVTAISTTMPLIDAEEWSLCAGDRETYDLVYGGVMRLAYLGFFVPPLLVVMKTARILRGDRGSHWGMLIDAFAIVEGLLAVLFALMSKQDAGRDLVIVSHALLLGALALVRPALSHDWRRREDPPRNSEEPTRR